MSDLQAPLTDSKRDDALDVRFRQLATSGRDALGRFVPGNSEALTHGAYRDAGRPELRALIEAERAAAVQALGGEQDLTPQMLRVVESYAKNAVLADAALEELFNKGGLTTTKGAQRAIVRVWQQLDEATVRRAQLLGLERRQRRVPNSVLEAIREAPEHAQRGARTARPVADGPVPPAALD